MAAITKLVDLKRFQWSQPSAANPRLAAPITAIATTITITNPPLDEDGKIVADAFIMGVKNKAGFTESILVPAAGVQGYGNVPDSTNLGTTLTGCTRGLLLTGLDYTTGSTTYAAAHEQDSPVFCNVAAFHFDAMISTLQGSIDTGAENWKIGNQADNDITVYAANGDANEPFWRYDASANAFVYSNDGVSSSPFGTGAGVTGGDGIDVTAGAISVDLATDPGLEISSATLRAKIKATGGVLRDADGLSVDQSATFDPDWLGTHEFADIRVNEDVQLLATSTEINQALDGIGATVTDTNLDTLTDGSDASALHLHTNFSILQTTKDISEASTSETLAHGLGVVPSYIIVQATGVGEAAASFGFFISGSNKCTAHYGTGNGTGYPALNDATYSIMVSVNGNPGGGQKGIITVDATNVTISWTKDAGNTGNAYVTMMVFA